MQAMSRLERSHSTRHSNVPRSRCAKCYFYSRQITTFLFSHIGLCTLLIGYALVGACIFTAIESENELNQRTKVFENRQETIRNLSIMTNESRVLNSEEWSKKARVILTNFEISFLKSVKVHGFDGVATNDPENTSMANKQWSFPGALLYSIIVITTIGYGNVAPRTDLGKIITILYAIIGIPLMLFCLSNIGFAMAHSFKFIYWKCCNSAKEKEHRRRMRKKRRLARQQKRVALISSQMNGFSGSIMPGNGPGIRYLNTTQTSLQPPIAMTTHQYSQLGPTPSPNETINQTTSTYMSSSGPHSATVPMYSDGQTIFFNQSSAEFEDVCQQPDGQQQSTVGKVNLGRSLSARYYGENQAQKKKTIQQNFQLKQLQFQHEQPPQTQQQQAQHLQQQFSPYLSPVLPPVEPLDNNPLSSVICNRYASLSDECLPTRLELDDRLNCSEEPNSKHSVPPRRTQSQVRFQRPTIITRRRHESIDYPDFANVSQPPILSTPLPYFDNAQPPLPGDVSNQSYYEDQTSSVFGSNFAQPPVPYSDLITDNESNDIDSDEDDYEKREKNIPIKVCFLLVVGYICGGAWFFSVSENWTFLDASYFCFVTLSTIGFGDLVPGRTVSSTSPEDSKVTLAVCALYLLFGMALLAMSLNLIKEKVTETVKSIGERIGLLVSDEEDDDMY